MRSIGKVAKSSQDDYDFNRVLHPLPNLGLCRRSLSVYNFQDAMEIHSGL